MEEKGGENMAREIHTVPTDELILMSQAIIKETKSEQPDTRSLTQEKRELIEELERRVGKDAWAVLALAS